MKKQDLAYYRRRLAAETEAARTATSAIAAERHEQLADEYMCLIEANGEHAAEEPTL